MRTALQKKSVSLRIWKVEQQNKDVISGKSLALVWHMRERSAM